MFLFGRTGDGFLAFAAADFFAGAGFRAAAFLAAGFFAAAFFGAAFFAAGFFVAAIPLSPYSSFSCPLCRAIGNSQKAGVRGILSA